MKFWLAALSCLCLASAATADPATFWDQTRRGTNSFNRHETRAHLAAARDFGAGFVRMAIGKWKGEGRDFLAGDLDHYDGLAPADVAQLRGILDGAAAEHVPIMLTPLDLPGARWRQNNNNTVDNRLWTDKSWWDVSARYWRDIAHTFRGHPAIVAYNVLNEPNPEWGTDAENADATRRDAWCAAARGTARDLDAFYRQIVAAIRAEDPTTPIVLDAGSYANPMAFRCLTRIDDPNVLYAMHDYEPYEYTTLNINRGRFRYPGMAPYGGREVMWNAAATVRHLQPALDWADAQGVPRNRIILGEFGCDRRVAGCADYLRDVIAAAEAAHIHWAFYSFREDVWDAMDYELGAGPTPPGFWEAVGRGQQPDAPRVANPMAEVLRQGLRGPH